MIFIIGCTDFQTTASPSGDSITSTSLSSAEQPQVCYALFYDGIFGSPESQYFGAPAFASALVEGKAMECMGELKRLAARHWLVGLGRAG